MATKKKRARSRKKPAREYLSLVFEVTDYFVDTSIHLREPGVKFKDLLDEEKLWEQVTYVEIKRSRVDEDSQGENLYLTVHISDAPRDLERKKEDYAEYVETEDRWRRERKTCVRRGVEEFVYREPKGFGYCQKGRAQDGVRSWSLMVDMTPAYGLQVMHTLSMEKRTFVDTRIGHEARHYWIERFGITNDPESVAV
jgi:hypothetical protein